MESAKMGKCGCGPFKIHKKKVFALLRVITKVFLLCDTNVSKMGRNCVPSAERKSCKCQLKCQLNRVSPVHQKKKNWKAMTQHQSLLRELAHQIWVRVFFGLLNRLHMLCHCFSELWSFFPFSSETLDWHCRCTFVITHINAITFFLCIFNGSKQHLLTFHLCHSPLCLLNWIGGVQIYLIW